MSQTYFWFFTGHSGGDYSSPDASGKGKKQPLEPESIDLTHYVHKTVSKLYILGAEQLLTATLCTCQNF
jgi:hypothetical protein